MLEQLSQFGFAIRYELVLAAFLGLSQRVNDFAQDQKTFVDVNTLLGLYTCRARQALLLGACQVD